MVNWIESSYLPWSYAALTMLIIGLWLAAVVPGLSRWSRRFFLVFFGMLIVATCLSVGEIACTGKPGMARVVMAIVVVETVLDVVSLHMLTIFLLHYCGEEIRDSILFHTVTILMSIFLVMIVSTPFVEQIAYYTPDAIFVAGPLYPLLVLPISLIMILNSTALIRRRRKLTRKAFCAFLITFVPLTIVLIVHMFTEVFPLVGISLAICAISMFRFILGEDIRQSIRQQQEIADQQREIARQRANITVLQLRPHFIFNTMTSIYALCALDPKKAQEVTLDFTTYLRKNFTAIASDETIPFTEELAHARAYLAVEKAQFEDELMVDYDTPHTFFRIPPLTLQPIVENAVKHGLDPDAGQLHIKIRTRQTNAGSEVIVEDDGIGYTPVLDEEPHIALANIQQRLAMMCGGTMSITPRSGGGTMVKLYIPW